MTIAALATAVLAVFGCVYVTTASVLFSPVRLVARRRFGEHPFVLAFLYCPKCQAFWFGLALGARGAWGGELVDVATAGVTLGFVAMGAVAACEPLTSWAMDAFNAEHPSTPEVTS